MPAIQVTVQEYKTLLFALYLAAEWEDSVLDSLYPLPDSDPTFAAQKQSSREKRDSFLQLKARLKHDPQNKLKGVKPMPRRINFGK